MSRFLEGFVYDLRFALRGLRRDRAFTLGGIAMLALAIGLNVTVFTVMNAALFRGYPLVKRNDRLLHLKYRPLSGSMPTTYLDFEAWRAQARGFEGMAFVGGVGRRLQARMEFVHRSAEVTLRFALVE